MSLIKLKDIGKIYVSEGNVSVGIRGVNLEFNIGEFVAITGESGSGKSTLLNVISGMDTYEEGEMFVENEPTSHYMQVDWEEYREKYISFIFQNYNIIDSFTVLQNVELSLMSIEDSKERRKKALELIERVGLKSHIHHRGSKLSGGQKQRTVIARALAKDSPIILADEPTGNLDSKSSKEIIELLHEVSKDKLVIVVTHNEEEVKDFATRHIRIFDGKVDFDKKLSEDYYVDSEKPLVLADNKKKSSLKSDIKNGIKLGRIIFTSKPKLSIYLCLLMIVGSIALFFSTVGRFTGLSVIDEGVFNHIDGRVVISKRDSSVITDNELETLSKDTNALGYMHYDYLLDESYNLWVARMEGDWPMDLFYEFNYRYGKTYEGSILGRYPEKTNEVFLYLPISEVKAFGDKEIITKEIYISQCKFDVVGVKYYYDNRINPEILLTKEGYELCTGLANLYFYNSITFEQVSGEENLYSMINELIVSFDIPKNMIYIDKKTHLNNNDLNETAKITYKKSYIINEGFNGSESKEYVEYFDYSYLTTDESLIKDEYIKDISKYSLVCSPNILLELSYNIFETTYRQASLFYENDKEAEKALSQLNEKGYTALLSNTENKIDGGAALLFMIGNAFSFIGWIITIIFIAVFINLCSKKSILAFKDDIAIMRSMGIQSKVIKIATYVRMIISSLFGIIAMIASAIFIYVNPVANMLFAYIPYSNYILMIVGLILLTILVTRKQIKNLFTSSVRVTLKGGAN